MDWFHRYPYEGLGKSPGYSERMVDDANAVYSGEVVWHRGLAQKPLFLFT